MKFTAWYAIIVGLLMVGQWSFFLATGQVPEIAREPLRIAFHLAAEFATATGLLVSGVALLRQKAWAKTLYFVTVGMLLYSVIASPGYFAQLGEWALVAMFALLLVLALVSLLMMVRVDAAPRPLRGA